MIPPGAEGLERSPYMRLRVGRVESVYDSGLPEERLGTAKIRWLDAEGGRDLVQISFGSFSNPGIVPQDAAAGSKQIAQMNALGQGSSAQPVQVGLCYGDLSLPSKGDVALIGFRSQTAAVIIGYLPNSYGKQTSADAKDSFWGTMRRIKPGELTRKSKQQAEIWQDSAGAVHIIALAQPTVSGHASDGSDTSAASDIDPSQAPKSEIARITVGECYSDDSLSARDVASTGKKVVLRIKMSSGASLKVDTDGNVDFAAASGKALALNSGTKGVARADDAVVAASADGNDTQKLFLLLQTLVTALTTAPTVALDGGAAYKAGITTQLATAGFSSSADVPTSVTGKVTGSSSTVKAG